MLLTQLALDQMPTGNHVEMLSIPDLSCKPGTPVQSPAARRHKDLAEIEKWLGSSVDGADRSSLADCKENTTRHHTVVDDEVVPAYVLTRLLSQKEDDDPEDLENNFLLGDSCLRHNVETTVELMSAKIQDFAVKSILRYLVFEAKVMVRRKFQEMDQVN